MINSFVEFTVWKRTAPFWARSLLSLTCCLMVMLGGMLVTNESQAQTCQITASPEDRVVLQNVNWLNVRSEPRIRDNNIIGKVYNDNEGTLKRDRNGEYVVRDGKYVWHYVKWDHLRKAGWTAGIIDDQQDEYTIKWIATILETDQKDAIVEALFKNITHDKTNHDYNDYGCNANWGRPYGYPETGHTGWDVQTKDKSTNQLFYSLTAGRLLRKPVNGKTDDDNTIAIYDEHSDRTVLYLHASVVLVKPDDKGMVKVGQLLGRQGRTGRFSTGVHVHIEVQEGESKKPASRTQGNETTNPIPYLYEWVTTMVSQELSIGDTVIVQNTSNAGLNIRSGAGTDRSRIGNVPDGATGTITDGPRTANGYKWWKVDWEDAPTGWSVEATDVLHLRQSSDTPVQCSYILGATTRRDVPADGESFTVSVTTTSGCTWTANTDSRFLSVSPSRSTGGGTVTVTVSTNTGAARLGTLTIAEQTFIVEQRAHPDTPPPGDGVCDRTPQVRDQIVKRTPAKNCAEVTEDYLNIITKLSLSNSGITTLQLTDFDGLRSLKTLNLGKNDLRTLPAGIFSSLAELTTLELDKNQFTTLSVGVFDGLDSLTKLYLDGNQLTMLPAGVFDGLNNLTKLNLEDNNLTTLQTDVFKGLASLEDLYLEGNPLTTIKTGAFNGLNNLTKLDLYENQLTTIEAGAFNGLNNLTTLDLYENQLTTLPVGVFDGLNNLTRLDLYENQLTTLPVGVFDGLNSLTRLDLDGNQLTTLPVGVFDGLNNLTKLYLDGNQLTTLPVGVFDGLNNLTTLDLEENQLTTLPKGIFDDVLDTLKSTLKVDDSLKATLSFKATTQDAVEGTNVRVTVSLSRALPVAIRVPYTVSGTATAADYTNLQPSAELLFLAGETNKEIVFTLLADTDTVAETVELTLGDTNEIKLRKSDGSGPDTTLGSRVLLNPPQPRSHTVTVNALAENQVFDLFVPSGGSLIHVPLKVTAVDGLPRTITSIADLYDALGGASAVNFLITHHYQTQTWRSYLGELSRGTAADPALTDDIGIMAVMKNAVTIRLSGDALGTNGTSTITLNPGLNFVGLPLRDSRITRVSDLFALDGIRDNVPMIILSDNGEFKTVGRAGDPDDIEVTGGQAFILNAQQAATVTISGAGWTNGSDTTAAPLVGNSLLQRDATPVLALRGAIVEEATHSKVKGFRVTVKNLSTGRTVTGMTRTEGVGYQLTVVEVETGWAAQIGDILEITAQSPHPLIGVEPLRYTITAEDVKRSLIQLPDLILYEIPAETELLANYPNPFNPETWIPYRLAEDAHVTLTIYGTAGQVVRTIDVGHRVAAVYESRSKAIYWDGRNHVGESVASGVYFYHLSVGDYSAIRKMVILK